MQASDFGKPIPSSAPGSLNPQKVFKALRGRRLSSGLGCFEGAARARAARGDLSAVQHPCAGAKGASHPRSRRVCGRRCFPLPPALSHGGDAVGVSHPQGAWWACSTWLSTTSRHRACCWPGSPSAVPPATGSPGQPSQVGAHPRACAPSAGGLGEQGQEGGGGTHCLDLPRDCCTGSHRAGQAQGGPGRRADIAHAERAAAQH